MRAFIAVDVSTVDAISKVQKEIMMMMSSAGGWSAREAKPVDPNNFHFTLLFLGEIQDTVPLQSKLSELQFEPFDITYGGIGGFPRPDAARVIWIGTDSEGSRRLSELAGKVASCVSGLGFRPDKPFSPHLTIFRLKGRPMDISAIAAKWADSEFATDRINRVHLKRSDLALAGPTYSNVYTVEAGK